MPNLRERIRVRRGDAGMPGRPVVQCSKDNPKSGCRYCPLLAWSHDFDDVTRVGGYYRDATKIRAKEREKHSVRTRCVEEDKWPKVDALFVGEAPGADEDREGVPFVGRAGKLLREAIGAMSHVKAAQCGITNAVRCRPPRNRTPGKTEIQSCLPRLVAEIRKREPKVLVALGNTPLQVLANQTGITSYNGRILPCTLPGFEHLKVVACLHPAYVLRADHETEKFVSAIETVQSFLRGEIEDKGGVGVYKVVTMIERLRSLMARLMRATDPVAVDTETGSLSPFQTQFPRLLCFSFSDKVGRGWVVPLDHKESPWRVGGPRESERPEVIRLVGEFAGSDVPKVVQSGKFDALHIRVATGVKLRNYTDIFHLHMTLDERRGVHGLEHHAWNYSSMGGYEKELEAYKKTHKECNPNKGGSYANIPGSLLFRYAGMDADVTKRAYHGLTNEPEYRKNPRFKALAERFLPALSEALTDIEFQGAQIDREQVAYLDKTYTAGMRKSAEAIYALSRVRKYERRKSREKGKPFKFNPGSPQQLQEVIFGEYQATPTELTDTGLQTLALRYSRAVLRWRKKRRGKEPSFRRIVRDSIRRKEWSNFSTKADVLHDIARQGNKLAPLVLKWRSLETLHGTFVAPMTARLDEHGRVHGTFNIAGTVTGRLSSSDPNLQNIPNKGAGLVKRAYVSRFGSEGLIGQVDYSQIELRVAACWFEEPTMMKAYRDGADLHLLTALDISRMSKAEYEKLDQHRAKEIRTQAKRINFGILYGGGPPALVNALKKDGVFITLDEGRALIERYFQVRPKLKLGIEKLEASVRELGYLESFTGRRRRVPEVFSDNEEIVARALRQSVNFPIQNGASEMTLMSLVLIWREMQRRNYRSKIILTVHDSIVFDLHVDEAFEVLALAKHIMENLPRYASKLLPGLDWSWLNPDGKGPVPLVADCEIGPSWGVMVEVKDPENPDVDELWEKMAEKQFAKVEVAA